MMSDGPASKSDNDVYTVLLIGATVLMIGATVYLGMRGQELFGSWNPFSYAG